MNGRVLLDTNIVIALFAGEAAIVNRLRTVDEVLLPSIVLGELYYGARKSGRPADNIRRLDEFAASSAIVSCNGAVARRYGEIKDVLRQAGRPIPENDIWIAAIAVEHQVPLISRDAHFDLVQGLQVSAW